MGGGVANEGEGVRMKFCWTIRGIYLTETEYFTSRICLKRVQGKLQVLVIVEGSNGRIQTAPEAIISVLDFGLVLVKFYRRICQSHIQRH